MNTEQTSKNIFMCIVLLMSMTSGTSNLSHSNIRATQLICTKIHPRKLVSNLYYHDWKQIWLLPTYAFIFFKGKSSSELNWIFIYFLSELSELLFFDLVRFFIWFHIPLYLLVCFCFHQHELVSNTYFHFYLLRPLVGWLWLLIVYP